MSYKIFVTDWIPELGRYAIITTSLQDPNMKHYAAECFVFALDEEPFFEGRRLTYNFDPIAENWTHVDEAYMHNEALGQAKNLISLERGKAYKRTKNIDVYRAEHDPQEQDAEFFVFGEIRTRYEDKLQELAKNFVVCGLAADSYAVPPAHDQDRSIQVEKNCGQIFYLYIS